MLLLIIPNLKKKGETKRRKRKKDRKGKLTCNNNNSSPCVPSSSEPLSCLENGNNSSNRKRRPAGTRSNPNWLLFNNSVGSSGMWATQLTTKTFRCRRRHEVPWKLLKRETLEVRKRMFVCPEPSWLHHDPCHALGVLVGIKKHFRRKHSNHKQWVCDKCSEGYAVQSDYIAHLKTCGTRGHSCGIKIITFRPVDLESFIEHQDACNAAAWSALTLRKQAAKPVFLRTEPNNLELQLLPSSNPLSNNTDALVTPNSEENQVIQLQLSIGSCDHSENNESNQTGSSKDVDEPGGIWQQAQILKEQATTQINSNILQITCQACKQQLQITNLVVPPDENSLAVSYMSSAIAEGEGEDPSSQHL
ncbi:hypothetical protein NE237_020577 [Protea cynaroides]|uniref:C2H2-type domain-containing protein n=1 Tax=Protea cynaroides TaxID=273540 RepID=A0A9Q0H6D2_9MAGN|nr:hypothetical protein NE237_020577 [Protea cynaroides]